MDEIGSMTEYFIKNSTAKNNYRAANPASRIINNYIFASNLVHDDIRCAMNNKCDWFLATNEEKEAEDLLKMIVCICCDRIYHLRCTGQDFATIQENELPWICHQCFANPMNPEAQSVVSAKRHLMPFDDRVKHFIKNQPEISENDSESESEYEMFNQTIHVDDGGAVIPNDYVKIIEKLKREVAETKKENSRLASLLKHDQTNNENTGIQPTHLDTTYSSAILQANAASTGISDPINGHIRLDNLNVTKPVNNSSTSSSAHLDSHMNHQQSTLHKSCQSSIEATTQHMNMLTINEIRRSLPKIESFDGRPERWLTFERAVNRNWKEGKYSDDLMKLHIRHALTGQALARVDGLIDLMSASQIMKFLKESFGNSNVVMENARQKLLCCKLSKPLTHTACVEATTLIASYMSACNYAGLPIADASLSARIHNQLEPFHQQSYYEFYFRKFPTATTRLERLDIQFEFLNSLSRTLPIGTFGKSEDKQGKCKGQNYQVMSASFKSPVKPVPYKSHTNDDGYKFEIRDRDTARYIGYDLIKLTEITKHCEICNKNNHYTVECDGYKSMKMDARYNLAKTKNICMNCMVSTSHMAKDCELKSGCGHKLDKNARCSAKHHITLHRNSVGNYKGSNSPYKKQMRRANSHKNQAKAEEKINLFNQSQSSRTNTTAQVLQQQIPIASQAPVDQNNLVLGPATPQAPQGYALAPPATVSTVSITKPYQIYTVTFQANAVEQSSQRTVKLFKTFFYGVKNKAVGYAIGDSAAEITMIRRDLIDDLKLTGENTTLEIQWTDGNIKRMEALKVQMKISGILPGNEILTLDECYAVNDLELPARTLNVEQLKSQFSHLKNVKFDSYKDAVPSLLIGSRHAHMIEAVEPVIQDGSNKPIAIKTKLGYSIYGGAPECFSLPYSVNNIQLNKNSGSIEQQQISNESLSQMFTYACSIDSLGIKPTGSHMTKDEKAAMELVKEEMRILPDGSIELPLIWKKDNGEIPSLPNNFAMAYKRQVTQEIKLSKTPELLKAYNDNFIELIKQNYVRPATERDMKTNWPNVWYLPMSLVVNQNKQPIKTRNVYDASARYKGTSLNENLLMGPNLLVDMLNPLMRMRMHKYAFTGDVKSMFHRVLICERDQQCQRILWREKPSDPMQVYIQQVMLFGPKSSPFASQIVKNDTADKWTEIYPKAAQALKDYTYMDDLLTSETTIESAIEVAKNCIKILGSINWELVNFQCNSVEVLQALSSTNVKQEVIDLMTHAESSYTTKVLGVSWSPKLDCFTFHVNKNAFVKLVKDCGHKPTKRDQCSTIARIFDIIGFVSHCVIRGKILLQRSWRNKIDWDEEISDEDHVAWIKWLNDLENISLLKIPRLRFYGHNMTDASSLELHTFCDAGKEAFAAVSYFVGTINNYRYVSFVMSKAKVTPIKLKTKTEISEMPRLELLAALIAARLSQNIINLHKDYKIDVYLWSDSEIVLNWIRNENLKLPKFAISPIEEILEVTELDQWRYVDTKTNVADLATKFQKVNFGDINSEWFQGPKFLKLSKEHWPTQKVNTSRTKMVATINLESVCVRNVTKLPPIDCPIAGDTFIDLLSSEIQSRWNKLVRAVGRALKLYYNGLIPLFGSKQWRNSEVVEWIKSNNDFVNLSPMEVERSELFIIRRMQRESYPVEYERLSKNKRISNKELLQLNVFLDTNGIIRISSRVDLPMTTYAQKNAPLVPRKSRFTTALLFHIHYVHRHVGIEAQVADFRSKYWMPQLRTALMTVKSMCNYCGYMRANPIEYKMAALPDIRTDPTLKPFEVTGLDCAGPYIIYAKNGHSKKVWILIFTCTMSRFIHLHLLDNLSTLAVFEAIMSLWSSHGPVRQFISDNGTNFVGTANVIRSDANELMKFLKESQRELESKLAQESYVSWYFIPIQSPWFGAFYERLIQSVKKSIASTIDSKKISRVEFNIALQEAAHRINCRPLTHNPISAEDEEVLTPHHLAKLRSGWPLIPSIHAIKEPHDPLSDKNEYRRGRVLAEEITRKFVMNYLPVLTKRTKWFKEFPPIKTNDLVLMIDPNKTRRAWERAKVLKIYCSKDNNARVVDLLLADGTIRKNRSVKRLAKLDIRMTGINSDQLDQHLSPYQVLRVDDIPVDISLRHVLSKVATSTQSTLVKNKRSKTKRHIHPPKVPAKRMVINPENPTVGARPVAGTSPVYDSDDERLIIDEQVNLDDFDDD